jgi:hypothetical protein
MLLCNGHVRMVCYFHVIMLFDSHVIMLCHTILLFYYVNSCYHVSLVIMLSSQLCYHVTVKLWTRNMVYWMRWNKCITPGMRRNFVDKWLKMSCSKSNYSWLLARTTVYLCWIKSRNMSCAKWRNSLFALDKQPICAEYGLLIFRTNLRYSCIVVWPTDCLF